MRPYHFRLRPNSPFNRLMVSKLPRITLGPLLSTRYKIRRRVGVYSAVTEKKNVILYAITPCGTNICSRSSSESRRGGKRRKLLCFPALTSRADRRSGESATTLRREKQPTDRNVTSVHACAKQFFLALVAPESPSIQLSGRYDCRHGDA